MEPNYIVKLKHKDKLFYVGVVSDRLATVDKIEHAYHFPPPKINAIVAAEAMRGRFNITAVEIVEA